MPGPSPGKTWALLMAALLLLGASYSASKPRAGRLRESLMVGASTFLDAAILRHRVQRGTAASPSPFSLTQDIWGNDTKLDGVQLKQLR